MYTSDRNMNHYNVDTSKGHHECKISWAQVKILHCTKFPQRIGDFLMRKKMELVSTKVGPTYSTVEFDRK